MRLNAKFLRSAPTLAECPRWNRFEVAIIGRSNVGKSSFLNALAGRRNLARISKTPGRTRSLNFFTIGEQLALVDMPGYGYAKMAFAEAKQSALLIDQYLRLRRELKALVLLVDARRGPQSEELTILDGVGDPTWRIEPRPHLILVATKCDKLKRAERRRALERFEAISAVPLLYSSLTGEGVKQVRNQIIQLATGDNKSAEDANA